MLVQAIVNSVAPRAAGNTTIYDIDLGGQVYSTFDAEMMRLANDHLGQVVTAEVDVKPSKDGRFTNYFFNGIPGAAPVAASIVAPQAMAQQLPQLMGPPAETQADKEARITKLASRRDAVTLVAALYEGAGPEGLLEAVNATKALAKEFYRDVMGTPPAALQAVPEPAPQQASQNEVPVSTEIPDW